MGSGTGCPSVIISHQSGGDELLPFLLSGGPSDFLPVPSIDGLGQPAIDSDDLPEGDHNREVQRLGGVGFDSFLGILFQLAVYPFNWIDNVMEDVVRQVGKMLDNEAGREPDGEETDEPNMDGLKKKYPWWLAERKGKELATSLEKADLEDTVTL